MPQTSPQITLETVEPVARFSPRGSFANPFAKKRPNPRSPLKSVWSPTLILFLVERSWDCFAPHEPYSEAHQIACLRYRFPGGSTQSGRQLQAEQSLAVTPAYFFKRSRISLRSFTSWVGSGAGGAASSFFSLLIPLIARNSTVATIRKFKATVRN